MVILMTAVYQTSPIQYMMVFIILMHFFNVSFVFYSPTTQFDIDLFHFFSLEFDSVGNTMRFITFKLKSTRKLLSLSDSPV